MNTWVLGLLVALLSIPAAHARPGWATDAYDAAGKIQILDSRMVMIGAAKAGENVLDITPIDVTKFTGHLCAGGASGFVIARDALKALYPKGIPLRQQITAVVSSDHDVSEILSYVLGVGVNQGEGSIQIDKTLEQPMTVVMVLTRKDTKAAVKVVWHKTKIMGFFAGAERGQFMALKAKVKGDTATPAEKIKFGSLMQQLVQSILTGKVVPHTIEATKG